MGANIRATTTYQQLKQMRLAGCKEVWIGAESGSAQILKDMRKGITVEHIKKVFADAKSLGLYRRAYFLLGMPNESHWDLKLTEDLATEIDADEYGFSILAPYPNNIGFSSDLLDTLDWSKVDEYNNDITSTKYLSNAELHDWQNRLVSKFSGRMCYRQKGGEVS
jgi:radical SAM superfamily enzyme YgiQ (UPF0313 family)